jgi:hypothetical protein
MIFTAFVMYLCLPVTVCFWGNLFGNRGNLYRDVGVHVNDITWAKFGAFVNRYITYILFQVMWILYIVGTGKINCVLNETDTKFYGSLCATYVLFTNCVMWLYPLYRMICNMWWRKDVVQYGMVYCVDGDTTYSYISVQLLLALLFFDCGFSQA